MRILLDMDDTICSLVPKWVYYYNKKYGTHYKIEDIKAWELPGDWRLWEEILKEESFYRDLPWTHPNNPESIRRLAELGHDVGIATSAVSGEAAKGKYMWCHTHLVIPGIIRGMDRVWIGRDKSWLKGDMLVDDNVDNLNKFPGVGVCMDQPWNQDWEGPRIDNLDQLPFVILKTNWREQRSG